MNIFIELKKSYGSQKKAADAFNVSGATFSDWTTNKKIPGKANIIRLRKAGFSAEQIFNSVFIEKPIKANNHVTTSHKPRSPTSN